MCHSPKRKALLDLIFVLFLVLVNPHPVQMSSDLDAAVCAYLAGRARVERGEHSVEKQPQPTSGQGSSHCCATECKRLADEIVSLRGVLEHLSSLIERTQQQSPVTCRSPMSMNLPVQLSLFSGMGRDHDFRSWIKLFERVTRACGITESSDLLSVLDVHLTGPASRLLTNLRRDGALSFQAVKSFERRSSSRAVVRAQK